MKIIFIFYIALIILILYYLNKHKINENYDNYIRKNNIFFLNPYLTLSSEHEKLLSLNKICKLPSK